MRVFFGGLQTLDCPTLGDVIMAREFAIEPRTTTRISRIYVFQLAWLHFCVHALVLYLLLFYPVVVTQQRMLASLLFYSIDGGFITTVLIASVVVN
jgi:hypothetical protein